MLEQQGSSEPGITNPRRLKKDHGWLTTRWTVIRKAAGGPDAREALETLFQWYRQPVCAFYRSIGTRSLDPEDLTQGLFASLLARNDISRLDPDKGRFRSWLRQAARFYLYNQFTPAPPITIRVDPGDPDGVLPPDSGDQDQSDRTMDRSWAQTVVNRAMAALETRYVHDGNRVQFELLRGELHTGKSASADRELADQLGMSEGAVRKAKFDMRDKFRHCIRAEIAKYVPDPRDIKIELRYLVEALS